MNTKINLSLTKKYLSVGVIGLLSIVITFTIINTNYQNINLRDQHLKQAQNLLTILEVSTAEDLYSMRLDHLRQMINFIKKNNAVKEVLILDNNNMIVTDGLMNSPMKSQTIDDEFLDKALLTGKMQWVFRNRDIYLFVPVDLPNMRLGAIEMIYSLEELRISELEILYNNLKFSVLIFIFGFVLVFFFIRKIVDPIRQLTDATIEVASGNYDQQIPINTRDELEFLADSFNTMVREVKQARDEMLDAKNKAESSDRLKTEFLAQMSHEIRTPINAIVNFTSLLKSEFEYKLYGEVKESFEIIEQSSSRLIRTIDLILNMAELQTGSYKADFAKFDIYEEILSRLLLEFKLIAKEKGLSLIAEKNTTLMIVSADKYSLTQLFSNLIDNALKYTVEGEVKLLIDRDSNNQLYVNVSDTGIGIAQEFLPFIFEPFMQEDQGYSRSYEGTGLGLALVKRYSEINNADLKVVTSKDKGTTFTVTFVNR